MVQHLESMGKVGFELLLTSALDTAAVVRQLLLAPRFCPGTDRVGLPEHAGVLEGQDETSLAATKDSQPHR